MKPLNSGQCHMRGKALGDFQAMPLKSKGTQSFVDKEGSQVKVMDPEANDTLRE